MKYWYSVLKSMWGLFFFYISNAEETSKKTEQVYTRFGPRSRNNQVKL